MRRQALMLPCPEDSPPGQTEPGGLASVALLIFGELRQPVTLVGLRERGVLRASMPKTPIDEHSNPRSGEYDVDGDPFDATVEAESKSLRM